MSITIVTAPSDSGGEVYYAQELGIFKKHGLDVQIIPVTSGQAASAAIASGKYDIGQSNVAALSIVYQRGISVVFVAPASMYSAKAPTTALVIDKASAVKSAADLAGKTIGAPGLGDIGTIAVDAWLREHNMKPSAVHMIEMPSGVLEPALGRGTIAAATLLEPYLSAALAKGDTVLANIYSSIAPQFLIAAYYSTNDWKKSHPAVARAFAEAMAETARWANQNHAQSAQILERSTGIHIAPGQTRPIYAETLDPAMIQPVIDAAATDGVLTASFPAASLLGR